MPEAAVVDQAVDHHQDQAEDAGGDAGGQLVTGQRRARPSRR